MISLKVADEAGMVRLGETLGGLLRPGDVVLLQGDLGAGKTTLARAMIRAVAGAAIDVPSPTFPLIEAYDFETPLYHVDLYRLESGDEARELGLEDLMAAGTTLVEWPERVPGLFTGPRLEIAIAGMEDDARMITLTPHGDAWTGRLGAMPRSADDR